MADKDRLERIYTVPLGDAYRHVRDKRAKKAVSLLKTFLGKHMKAEDGEVVVSNALNSHIWKSGIQKPPRRVKVRAIREAGVVKAFLHDEKTEEKKKEAPKKEEKPAEKKVEPKAAEKPAEKKAEAPKEEKSAEKKPEPKKEEKPAEGKK